MLQTLLLPMTIPMRTFLKTIGIFFGDAKDGDIHSTVADEDTLNYFALLEGDTSLHSGTPLSLLLLFCLS